MVPQACGQIVESRFTAASNLLAPLLLSRPVGLPTLCFPPFVPDDQTSYVALDSSLLGTLSVLGGWKRDVDDFDYVAMLDKTGLEDFSIQMVKE